MYKLNKYPDGTSYINTTSTKPLTIRVNTYEDLWNLNQYVDAFISEHGFKPNVRLPNLIDAQADRRFDRGESYGLKLVLKFLKSLPVKEYIIFHPHNQEVVEMYLDNVIILDNSEFIMNVLCRGDYGICKEFYFSDLELKNNLILMSADAGGYKPLMKLCDKIKWNGETFSASKSRSYDNGKTNISQIIDRDDFGGKNILIVDDICVFGGTFKGLSKLLKQRNCGKLYLAVSHMTIENHKGSDTIFDYFDKVFTTNSKFEDYYVADRKGQPARPKNLEVIKMFDI